MTHLYKGFVSETQWTGAGVGWFMQSGEPRTVDGTPMVQLGKTAIVAAEGWHADKSAALVEIAARIETMGEQLLAQAAQLRQEAAEEAARKAVVTT